MIKVDTTLIQDLIEMSGKDDIRTYCQLIDNDLKRHFQTLEEGMQKFDKGMRSKALHGIYQVAASFGLTTVRQITAELQEKNNSGSDEIIDQAGLGNLETIIKQSLDYLLTQPG